MADPKTLSGSRDARQQYRQRLSEAAPALAQMTDEILFGRVWERPQLSKRDRSLITCTALVALGASEQMTMHIPRALENGVTKEELIEMITHMAFYSGWPAAVSAAMRAREIFDQT
jgi:4-carboxymuconolactone decarboxylase